MILLSEVAISTVLLVGSEANVHTLGRKAERRDNIGAEPSLPGKDAIFLACGACTKIVPRKIFFHLESSTQS
jgi:hypothetical protein